MKKRLVWLLIFAMIISSVYVPVPAYATEISESSVTEEVEEQIDSVIGDEENNYDAAPSYTISGTHYAQELVEGASYTLTGDTVIILQENDNKTIEDIKYNGTECSLTITGSNKGTLKVNTEFMPSLENSSKTFTLAGGKLICKRVYAGGDITISDGELNTQFINSCLGNVKISGGIVVATNDDIQYGITAFKDVYISGGKVTASSTHFSGINAAENLKISGGIIDAAGGTYNGNKYAGIQAGYEIIISGDSAFITTKGDRNAICAFMEMSISDKYNIIQPSTGKILIDKFTTVHEVVTSDTEESVNDAIIVPASQTFSIAANTTSCDWGEVEYNYTVPAAKTVTIENTGYGALKLSDINPDSFKDFTVSKLSSTYLLAGEKATFTIQPKATLSSGEHTIKIPVNTDQSGISVEITAKIKVKDFDYSFSMDDVCSIVPAVKEGYDAKTVSATVRIANTCKKTLHFEDFSANEFIVEFEDEEVPANTISGVKFSPKPGLEVGKHEETITIRSKEGARKDIVVDFKVDPWYYDISVSPATLDFGRMTVGYSKAPDAQTVTVTNDGDANVTLMDPSTFSSKYDITTQDDLTLEPGASLTLKVQPKLRLTKGDENIVIKTEQGSSAELSLKFDVGYFLEGQVKASDLVENADYIIVGDTVITLAAGDDKKLNSIKYIDDLLNPGANEYNLEIKGSNLGTLTVEGEIRPGWNGNEKTLKLSGGKVVCSEFNCGGDITINGGELCTQSVHTNYGNIYITGGTVNAKNDTQLDAIHSFNFVEISGGKVTGRSTHCDGIYAGNGITITGGVIEASGGTDQGSDHCGIEARGNFTISGDNTFIYAEGDLMAICAGEEISIPNTYFAYQSSTSSPVTIGAEGSAHKGELVDEHDELIKDIRIEPGESLGKDYFTITPGSIDFGKTVIGGNVPESQTVVVQNRGEVPLILKDIVSDKYLISEYSKSIILPGESASFTIAPDTEKIWAEGAGIYTEELKINVTYKEPLKVKVEAVDPEYSFSVSEDKIDLGAFPKGYKGEMPSYTFHITNTGNIDLKNVKASVNSMFKIEGADVKVIAPGKSVDMAVYAESSAFETAGSKSSEISLTAEGATKTIISVGLEVIDAPENTIWIEDIPDQTYTGKEIKPVPSIFYNGEKLTSKDYTISYKNNKNVAAKDAVKNKKSVAPTVTVKGKGNYSGTAVMTFNIVPADIANARADNIVLAYKDSVQKGKTKVTFEVDGKSVTLKENTDYTFRYTDGDSYKEPGNYYVYIVGKGNFTGEKCIEETILESDKILMSTVSIPKIPDQKYNAGNIILAGTPDWDEWPALTKDGKKKFDFVIKDAKKNALVYGVDYSLSYKNNKEIGTATVTVEGIGKYVGTRTVTFKITGTALSKVKTEGFVSSVAYTGKPVYQTGMKFFTKSGNAKSYLIANKDYTVSYKNNIEVGTATVTYTGKNAYTGTVTKTYKITGLDMKKVKIPKNFAATTGSYAGKNYTSEAYYDSQKGNFIYLGAPFDVAGPGNATSASDNNGIQLYYHDDKTDTDTYFTNGVDYVVTYKNNIYPGKATVTFTGKKGLTGSVSRTFKIVPYDIEKDLDDRIDYSLDEIYTYEKGGVKPVPTVEYSQYRKLSIFFVSFYDWVFEPLTDCTKDKKGNGFVLSYNKYTDQVTGENRPAVTIKGIGAFTGTIGPIDYTIVRSSLADRTEMTVSNVVYQNKAGICKPAITVTDKSSGKVLKAGTDYKKPEKYYYHNATTVNVKNSNKPVLRAAGDEVGSKDIIPVNTVIDFTIKGINNYVGEDPSNPDTVSGSFRIIDKKKDLSQAKITIKPQAYTGNKIVLSKEDISFTLAGEKCDLVLNKDYGIVYDNEKYDYTKKGTHKVVIVGLSDEFGSGYFGEKTVSFEIKAKSLVEKITNTKQLYVSSAAGDDDNLGTEEHPFKTIQKAIDEAEEGTIINVANGIYDELLTFEKSGTENAPIVLRGQSVFEEEGYLTCNTKLTYTGASDEIFLININGKSNIVIEQFDIGDISAHTAEGIFMPLNSKNITVRKCKIHDIKVLKADGEDGDCANAILCLGEGKKAENAIDNILIENNEICNNITNWSESVSFAGNVSNVKVYGNMVHDNSNIGIDFNGNTGYCKTPSLDQPRYCEAYNNVVFNCRSSYAKCAGIYVDGARDIIIRDNKVSGCDYGIEIGAEIKKDKYPVTNITVKSNEIKDNYHGGILVGGYDEKETGIVKDSVIFDNVLEGNVKDADSAEIIINRCSNIGFFSNDITDMSSNTNDVILIRSEMDEKNTFGLSFRNNQYRSAKSKADLHFVINGKEIVGFDEFTQTVGADDSYIIIK